MIGDRIEDPLHVLNVTPTSQTAGVPVVAEATLDEAVEALETARLGMRLPQGTYIKRTEDTALAVYQPVRYNIVWNPRIWWACYKTDLHARDDIYAPDFPINVSGQDSKSLKAHHEAPSRASLLWCYMRPAKFKSMLENCGVQLTRADLFSDRDEGTLRPDNLLCRRAVYADKPIMAAAGHDYTNEFRRMKQHTYVGCWRIDTDENIRSWDEYVGSTPGVAVVTTYGRLSRHLATLFCATVEYRDDGWIPEGNSIFPFIYKRKVYDWEQEFRIIHQRFPKTEARFRGVPVYDCSQISPNRFLVVRLDLNAVTIAIVIGPNTPASVKAELRELIRKSGLRAPIHDSVFSPLRCPI